MEKVNKLLENLNEAQYQATTADPGHQLIIAGAGSENTRIGVPHRMDT